MNAPTVTSYLIFFCVVLLCFYGDHRGDMLACRELRAFLAPLSEKVIAHGVDEAAPCQRVHRPQHRPPRDAYLFSPKIVGGYAGRRQVALDARSVHVIGHQLCQAKQKRLWKLKGNVGAHLAESFCEALRPLREIAFASPLRINFARRSRHSTRCSID